MNMQQLKVAGIVLQCAAIAVNMALGVIGDKKLDAIIQEKVNNAINK